MSRRRPLRVPPPAVALLLALACLAAAPPAAAVEDVTFEVHPAAPTWHDEVSITVRGESSCLVHGATGERHFAGPVLRIELQEGCIVDPPLLEPFEVTVPFGQLEPGSYAVHLTREGEEEPVLAESSLTVYEVADLQIAFPSGPANDAAAFVISVSGVAGVCSELSTAAVEGNVITLEFRDPGCPILPPPGGIQTFHESVGPLPAGDYEVRVFREELGVPALAKATVHVFDAEGCLPESDVLCLNQDRFAVSVQWEDFEGNEGVGQAIPLLDDTGLFWFFHPENVELTVKVIDACEPFGFFWVFVASGSTVEYEIRVTDTRSDTEHTKIYDNELGQVPSLIADTGAFFCP